MENLSLSDEDAAITRRDSQNSAWNQGRGGEGGRGGRLREERDKHETTGPRSCSAETAYRDPSLHKTSIEKHQYVCQKNASIVALNQCELTKLEYNVA